MIHINLLPKDEVPRSVQINLPGFAAFIPVIVALLVVGACATTGFIQKRSLDSLMADIELAEEESRRLAPQIARIKQLEREREQVDRRLDAITSLDRDRYYRVRLMSELTRRLPENSWLTLYEEIGPNALRIEGITFSNFVVADFLRDVMSSPYYQGIDLEMIERGNIKDVKVLHFSLTANVGQPATDLVAGL